MDYKVLLRKYLMMLLSTRGVNDTHVEDSNIYAAPVEFTEDEIAALKALDGEAAQEYAKISRGE
jgi:hypothetical protein